MGSVEPPACIQNAMMTKDKKPFTYTPGGLDLSQIRTPSMARRLARQRSLEEQEQAVYNAQHPANGGANLSQVAPVPPPPPPQAPPPPPPLIIETPNAKSPKPIPLGERPEIVIPENPIGMLRKTNSPYHWEAEKADMQRLGEVPKFIEKVPSPLTVKMPPSSFSQQPPQMYAPQGGNNMARPNNAFNSNRTPESPIHKPEPMYAHQNSSSPNTNSVTPTRDFLQRQDSQFNKSPMPFGGQSPLANCGSPFSPSPNSSWKQPDRRDSPAQNVTPPTTQPNRAPFSPQNAQQYSPNYQTQNDNPPPVYNTLPRPAQRIQDNYTNNLGSPRNNNNNNTGAIYNNTSNLQQRSQSPPAAPWRTNTLNRQTHEADKFTPTQDNHQSWKSPPEINNNQEPYHPPWKAPQSQQQQYVPPWVTPQESNNNRSQDDYSPQWKNTQDANNVKVNSQQDQPRYQSHMSIPVNSRKPREEPEFNQPTPPQKEAVYVNQEPVYFCPDSPNQMPPWVKSQKEKTKTPPPVWCQRPLDGRKSAPRELVTPPRDNTTEPEWVRKSNEMQRNIRDVVSPPKYQQPVQPNWSTRPSQNRKSLPRDEGPMSPGTRVIPIQMEASNMNGNQGNRNQGQPQLRIVIDMQNQNDQGSRMQPPYSQPTQRIMRVLSPQLVRLDDAPSHELPTLNRTFQNDNNYQQNQTKTRIIPIQLEGGNEGPNKRCVICSYF